MRRREFIAFFGSATVAHLRPSRVAAQQTGRQSRIGFFGASLEDAAIAAEYGAFLAKLKSLGFSSGENITVEYRRIDDPRGAAIAAKELIETQPDLIVVGGPEAALKTVLAVNRNIPIVLQAINFDPIEHGYIASLAHPGGNITGLFYRQPELAAKQLELLNEAFPDRTRLGALWDTFSSDQFAAVQRVAATLHLELQSVKLENPPYDFAAAFEKFANGRAQMVQVLSSPYFTEHRPEVAGLALRYRLPSMFIFKSYVRAGGLMSYGVDQMATYLKSADYVAKILRGRNPADLPVEQPSNFEFALNLKTAKAIGVTVPTSILLRADEVIE